MSLSTYRKLPGVPDIGIYYGLWSCVYNWHLLIAVTSGALRLPGVLKGRKLEVQALLDKGADPNVRVGFGAHVVLHQAVLHADRITTEIVELLLEGGADPNALDIDGKSPLEHARFTNFPEMIELLIEHGAQE